jgi:hypothetical protein
VGAGVRSGVGTGVGTAVGSDVGSAAANHHHVGWTRDGGRVQKATYCRLQEGTF